MKLDRYDRAWLQAVFDSRAFKSYLSIPPYTGEMTTLPDDLESIPLGELAALSMVESFCANPNWERVWRVAATHPSTLESGIAILNFMERDAENPTWSGAYLERTDVQAVSTGFAACLFAHIRDEPSIMPINWWNWIGDTRASNLNHFLHCGRFLVGANEPYMIDEWKRIATFSRNEHLHDLAQRVLTESKSGCYAREFSAAVEAIRNYNQRMAQVVLTDGS
ncbi:MAG: hypothetical protein ACYTG5_07005 [Planctomycetota bacterium]